MNTEKLKSRIRLTMMCPTCNKQVADGLTRCPDDDGLLCPVEGQDPLLGTSIGSHQIIEGVGQGSSGQVYLAQNVVTGLTVAIKVLKCAFTSDPASVKRFQQEAQALIALDHPDIPAVHDYGLLPDGRPYIVMEFVNGRTLAEVLESDGRLDYESVIQLMLDITDVLQTAHNRGILHRDIKPSNIIIDRAGNTKVVDFGLAKISGLENSATVTRTNATLGTPAYMSPEQCYGQELDARSDIYSLGCVMYECLTGKQVFQSNNSFKCMHDHVFTPPQPVSELEPGIPLHLEALVLNCLEKEPDLRVQSMAELKKSFNEVRGLRSTKFAYIHKSLKKLKNKGRTRKKASARQTSNSTATPGGNNRSITHPLGTANFSRMVEAEKRWPFMISFGSIAALVVFVIVFSVSQIISSERAEETPTAVMQEPAHQHDLSSWSVDPWSTQTMTGILSSKDQAQISKLAYQGVWCPNGLWSPDGNLHSILGRISLNGPDRSKVSDVDFPAFAGVLGKNDAEWFLLNEEVLAIYELKTDMLNNLPIRGHVQKPSAITYDTRRDRAVIVSEQLSDMFYTYERSEKPWSTLSIANKDEGAALRGIAYDRTKDSFYCLKRNIGDEQSDTSLLTIDAKNGNIQKTVRLSKNLCSKAAWNIGRISLALQGKYLIATLFRTSELHDHELTPRMFVIDPASGAILYAHEIAHQDQQ